LAAQGDAVIIPKGRRRLLASRNNRWCDLKEEIDLEETEGEDPEDEESGDPEGDDPGDGIPF
jgi:hypothetical protein